MGAAVVLIGKGGKLTCKVVKGIHITANVASMLKSTYVIGANIDRYLINGEEFSWSQLGMDILTIGLEGFALKNAAKGLSDAQSQSWCFVAGTLVLTEDGQKPIEEIEAGDTVLAEDPETGKVEYKEVLETYENETEELIHVHENLCLSAGTDHQL